MFDLLELLKNADWGREAGPQVEARILASFRKTQRVRRIRRFAGLTAIAAAGLIGVVALPHRHQPLPIPESKGVAGSGFQPAAELVLGAPPPPPTVPAPPQRRRQPKRQAPQELATDFIPLMDAPPPFERGELLRVVVPAATMRTVGLPVSDAHLSDPVEADVLVGQEGLARAIRFVSFQP